MTREEAILECRRRWLDGEFKRVVVKRVPAEVAYDIVHLSCGHSQPYTPRVRAEDNEELSCLACEKEWIRQNTEPKTMSVLGEKLTRDEFRKRYADEKPNWELIDGMPEQKALGSKRHSYLQGILYRMLDDLGFRTGTELTLEVSETWDPVPDVVGMLGPETGETYQNQPPAVVVEILSPSDRFTQVDKKCRRYAEWGIPDILIFDQVDERAWYWDARLDGLVRCRESYRFASWSEMELSLSEAFRRLDEKS